MTSNLRLSPKITIGDGPNLGTEPIQYEVLGLPAGQDILIGKMGHRWQILRPGQDWRGDYASADDTFIALRKDL